MRLINSAHVLLAALATASAQHAGVVRGVNLGSWLVCEPWMVPSLFESTGAVDEWSLCNMLGKDKCLETLQQHWSTFYTRWDFEQIKNAGLRYCFPKDAVRIPLGYWAVDLLDYEPYVSGQYPYLIQGVQWANELGLKVFIDLHGAPGSQNGWEESGLVGPVGFLTNSTNANRTLNVLRNLTEEFSKDIYGGAVTNIEPLNEPLLGYSDVRDFYTASANIIGAANSSGINITISDGFFQPHSWTNYDPWDWSATSPAPHITIDTHQFWGFPPLNTLDKAGILQAICTFGQGQLRTAASFGVPPTIVGEFSLASGITSNSTTNTTLDVDKRTWFRTLFEAQNAAFTPTNTGQSALGWYFWAWKTEYDIDAWSYRKGLELQYIPTNASDPKSYIFPINDQGCIDSSFKYTAPVLVQSSGQPVTTTSSGQGPEATTTGSANSSTSTGAGNAFAFAGRTSHEWQFVSDHGLKIWLAIATVTLVGIAL